MAKARAQGPKWKVYQNIKSIDWGDDKWDDSKKDDRHWTRTRTDPTAPNHPTQPATVTIETMNGKTQTHKVNKGETVQRDGDELKLPR